MKKKILLTALVILSSQLFLISCKNEDEEKVALNERTVSRLENDRGFNEIM